MNRLLLYWIWKNYDCLLAYFFVWRIFGMYTPSGTGCSIWILKKYMLSQNHCVLKLGMGPKTQNPTRGTKNWPDPSLVEIFCPILRQLLLHCLAFHDTSKKRWENLNLFKWFIFSRLWFVIKTKQSNKSWRKIGQKYFNSQYFCNSILVL